MKEISEEEIKKIKEDYIEVIDSAIAFLANHHYDTSKLLGVSRKMLDYVKQLESEAEYSGYYQSYLLGMINKEEFERISKKFIVETE